SGRQEVLRDAEGGQGGSDERPGRAALLHSGLERRGGDEGRGRLREEPQGAEGEIRRQSAGEEVLRGEGEETRRAQGREEVARFRAQDARPRAWPETTSTAMR